MTSNPQNNPHLSEEQRIKQVYAKRDATKADRYAFYKPDLRLQMSELEWALAAFFHNWLDGDLSRRHILDVGCGSGSLLATLTGWGADPKLMTGTELLADRLETAKHRWASNITWHHGDLAGLGNDRYDLAFAFTVFSSILDDTIRYRLAREIWERVKPGGWTLIFDFRYNNPSNPNVRKVTKAELESWWPASQHVYRTMLLLPPISRRISPHSYLFAHALSRLLPFLRSHFLFAARKPNEGNSLEP